MKQISLIIALSLTFLHRTSLADSAALLAAVEASNASAVTNLLTRDVKLEVRDQRGWTPLIIAANQGNVVIASLLVAKGADVNACSSSTNGSTVLCFAAQHSNTALLELLLRNGANIHARSKNGATALYAAISYQQEPATRLLIAKGARVDQLSFMNDRGCLFTPLILTATQGELKTAAFLLAHGASLEKRNNFGNTPLMEAAMRPQPQMIKFLIDRGAKVNAANPKGYTALLHAVEYGQIENIKVLLAAGADPFATYKITDDQQEPGWDGVRLAKGTGNDECATLILDAQKRARPATFSAN